MDVVRFWHLVSTTPLGGLVSRAASLVRAWGGDEEQVWGAVRRAGDVVVAERLGEGTPVVVVWPEPAPVYAVGRYVRRRLGVARGALARLLEELERELGRLRLGDLLPERVTALAGSRAEAAAVARSRVVREAARAVGSYAVRGNVTVRLGSVRRQRPAAGRLAPLAGGRVLVGSLASTSFNVDGIHVSARLVEAWADGVSRLALDVRLRPA